MLGIGRRRAINSTGWKLSEHQRGLRTQLCPHDLQHHRVLGWKRQRAVHATSAIASQAFGAPLPQGLLYRPSKNAIAFRRAIARIKPWGLIPGVLGSRLESLTRTP